MKLLRGLFVTATLCTLAGSVHADDIVLVPSLIPYAHDDTASEDVRKECDWNSTLPRYLARVSDGRVQVAQESVDGATDKKLLLVATHLHTAGGGHWSGPKWLVLEGKLTQGNKLIGNFEARRQTINGSMRGCGTLNSLGEEISDDILAWLKAPSLNARLGDAK